MSKDKKPWNIWEYLGMGVNTSGNFWEFLGIPNNSKFNNNNNNDKYLYSAYTFKF